MARSSAGSFTLLVLAGALIPAQAALADGKLQRAREQVRDRDDDRGSTSRSDRDDDDDDSDDILSSFVRALFSAGDHSGSSSSERYAPSYDSEPAPVYGYAPYPYARSHRGYLVSRKVELAYDGGARPLARKPNDFALQLSLEAGYLDGITRGGPSLRLLTPSRVELDTRWSWLHESLERQTSEQPSGDALNVGASHLSYRLGQDEAGMLRAGIGVRYLVDGEGADPGLDLLLGADLFVGQPFVLSLELTAGTLGDAVVFAPRAQLGVMLGRVELFAAYEHMIIGDVELPAPLLGTRIWF